MIAGHGTFSPGVILLFSLLARIFIKNQDALSEEDLRRRYGMLSGILGIGLNILLFAGKYIAGVLSCSIAITADAFNNLSDAGSSLITFCGFRFSGMEPDKKHPFGHGRIEYFSALGVAILIILMGFELLKSSVAKIFSPEPVDSSILSIIVLVVSICVKLYMFIYNRGYGKRLSSPAMAATATDSISDCAATFFVLLSVIITRFFGVNIDAYCGTLVSVFIIIAGVGTAKDTVNTLLGAPPSPEFVREIEEIVTSHPVIIGMHDLIVHDYGPGRRIISLHGEVRCDGDLMEIHDAIDHIERELGERLGCEAVIHMDPVEPENEELCAKREKLEGLLRSIDSRLTIHDLRTVCGGGGTSLIFDIVVPYELGISEQELENRIQTFVREQWQDHSCIIKFDKSFV